MKRAEMKVSLCAAPALSSSLQRRRSSFFALVRTPSLPYASCGVSRRMTTVVDGQPGCRSLRVAMRDIHSVESIGQGTPGCEAGVACAATSVSASCATGGPTNRRYHHASSELATPLREALRAVLCCPDKPLPMRAVFLQLCHPFRLLQELYHTSPSRRRAKLRSALQFLRRHNVLMHGLLFYVPSSLSSSFALSGHAGGTWNTTGEFTRLALYGEAYLHSELRTRLLKLMPDLPEEVFLQFLQQYMTEERYVEIFDALDMASLVGARPPKPEKLRTRKRHQRRQNNNNNNHNDSSINSNTNDNSNEGVRSEGKEEQRMSSQHHHCDNDLNSGSSRSRSTATASARLLLRQQRQRYRESLQLSPHQKASMLCAVLGELRWFGARTRPTHRTHNNAIFPPSDVLILHVLATHLVECLPAEMLLMALEPHLAAIQSQWQNFPMSLPTQLLTRFTPQPARYRLADVPTTNNNTTPITTAAQVSLPRLDLDGPPEQGFSGHQPPSSRAFATRMHPTIVVPVLQGSGCRSAALRRHVRAKLEVERDDWLWKKSTKDGPQSTSTSTTPPAATTFSTEEAPAQPQPLSSEQTDVPPSPSPPRAAMMSVDRLKELLSRVRAGEAALQKE